MTMVQLLTEAPDELGVEQVRDQISQLFDPLVPVMSDFLTERDLRVTDPALTLRLVMVLISATATFLPGTYPSPGLVPDSERIIDEVTALIVHGLHRPPAG